MNPVAPSSVGPLLKPVHFFWLLAIAEVGLMVFLLAQFPQVRAQKTQFLSLRDERSVQGSQAEQLQAQLQQLAGELLQLAESDPKAQALAAKYQIRRTPEQR